MMNINCDLNAGDWVKFSNPKMFNSDHYLYPYRYESFEVSMIGKSRQGIMVWITIPVGIIDDNERELGVKLSMLKRDWEKKLNLL